MGKGSEQVCSAELSSDRSAGMAPATAGTSGLSRVLRHADVNSSAPTRPHFLLWPLLEEA